MKPTRSRRTRLVRVALAAFAVFVWLGLGGCGQLQVRSYGPFVAPLDGETELRVTTYPAFFPRETTHIPFVYGRRVTSDSVYLQVHLRGVGRTSGPSPPSDSIRIHYVRYQIGSDPPVEVLTDFERPFWMQGQPVDDLGSPPPRPVPYRRGATVSINIALTLNGTDYTFEGEMPAMERTSTYPLVLERLQ